MAVVVDLYLGDKEWVKVEFRLTDGDGPGTNHESDDEIRELRRLTSQRGGFVPVYRVHTAQRMWVWASDIKAIAEAARDEESRWDPVTQAELDAQFEALKRFRGETRRRRWFRRGSRPISRRRRST